MFLRIDRLQVELPQPTKADPNSVAALQELLALACHCEMRSTFSVAGCIAAAWT
jgi:hypothetical protein